MVERKKGRERKNARGGESSENEKDKARSQRGNLLAIGKLNE